MGVTNGVSPQAGPRVFAGVSKSACRVFRIVRPPPVAAAGRPVGGYESNTNYDYNTSIVLGQNINFINKKKYVFTTSFVYIKYLNII